MSEPNLRKRSVIRVPIEVEWDDRLIKLSAVRHALEVYLEEINNCETFVVESSGDYAAMVYCPPR